LSVPVHAGGPRNLPSSSDARKSTRNITKSTQAIFDEIHSVFDNPSAPAISAMSRKTNANRNMLLSDLKPMIRSPPAKDKLRG